MYIFRLAQHDNCVQQCRNYNNSYFMLKGLMPSCVYLCVGARIERSYIHTDISSVLLVAAFNQRTIFQAICASMLQEHTHKYNLIIFALCGNTGQNPYRSDIRVVGGPFYFRNSFPNVNFLNTWDLIQGTR